MAKLEAKAGQLEKSVQRIALYGGSFHPLHQGHVDVVEFLVQKKEWDQVVLIPANNPPHKEIIETSSELREQILKKFIKRFQKPDPSSGIIQGNKVIIDDYELRHHDDIHYSIDCLMRWQKKAGLTSGGDLRSSAAKIDLVMGLDSLATFTSWKDWQEILNLARLVVAPRFKDLHEQQLWQKYLRQVASSNTFLEQEAYKKMEELFYFPSPVVWQELGEQNMGQILFLNICPQAIASSQIREISLKSHESWLNLPFEVRDHAEYLAQFNLI